MFGFFSTDNKKNTDAQYIFDYIKKQIKSFKKHTDKYDGVISYDDFTEEVLMGFFSYYIAGVYDADMARKIINLYVKEKGALNSNSIRNTIQESYTMAREISETLMQKQCDAEEISMGHALTILKVLEWEESDSNLTVFMTMFSDLYKYIECIYNNKLSSFKGTGLFEDFEAIDDIQRLKNGKAINISISQIVNFIISLQNAQKNLNTDEYNSVQNLFDEYRECTTKIPMKDIKNYYEVCADIIKEFDKIAPYESYSGLNPIEASFLMKEIRELDNQDTQEDDEE